MSRYILAPAAQEDLVAIRDYYLKEAGYRIARQMLVEFTKAFQPIAHTPGVGHQPEDLAGDRPATKPVKIVTIVRGSRDVAVILKRRE